MKFVLFALTLCAAGFARAEFALECGHVSFNGVKSVESYAAELTDEGLAWLLVTDGAGQVSRVSLSIEFSSRTVTTFAAKALELWIERTPDGFFLNTPHGQTICR